MVALKRLTRLCSFVLKTQLFQVLPASESENHLQASEAARQSKRLTQAKRRRSRRKVPALFELVCCSCYQVSRPVPAKCKARIWMFLNVVSATPPYQTWVFRAIPMRLDWQNARLVAWGGVSGRRGGLIDSRQAVIEVVVGLVTSFSSYWQS